MKKISTEEVNKIINNIGDNEFKLLSKYKGTKGRIEIKHTKCGHIFSRIYRNFIKNPVCPNCVKWSTAKRTEDFKKDISDLLGDEYELLDRYINNKTKVKIKHKICGNIWETLPNSVISGHECLHCRGVKTNSEFKNEIFDLVGDEYTLLTEYQRSNEKVTMKHNTCGNEYAVTPTSFLSGNRCPSCATVRKTHEDFIKEVKELTGSEYTVIGKYIQNDIHIEMKHNTCGNVWKVQPKNFISISSSRCPICNRGQKSNAQFLKEVKDLTGDDYTFLENYNVGSNPIKVRHNKCGNIYKVRPSDFIKDKGNRCPKCSMQGSSLIEKEILDFIKSFYSGKIIENYKSYTDPSNKTKYHEIDIYLPDLKIGIELDGLYWHSDLFVDKNYHLVKGSYFTDRGIKLINIFEDEWVYKENIVKSKIKYLLGHDDREKIYARKCTIKEISTSDKQDFLNKYHIQGADRSNIKLGMFYKNELISVMTFGSNRVVVGGSHKKGEYELIRFAGSKNVVGGFSKMLKYFNRNYEVSLIKTFADLRWSSKTSNVYLLNGFELENVSKPNYFYIVSGRRLHRYNFRKSELKNKFPSIYDNSLTEFEIMNKTNHNRIWDRGNLVYVFRNN